MQTEEEIERRKREVRREREGTMTPFEFAAYVDGLKRIMQPDLSIYKEAKP